MILYYINMLLCNVILLYQGPPNDPPNSAAGNRVDLGTPRGPPKDPKNSAAGDRVDLGTPQGPPKLCSGRSGRSGNAPRTPQGPPNTFAWISRSRQGCPQEAPGLPQRPSKYCLGSRVGVIYLQYILCLQPVPAPPASQVLCRRGMRGDSQRRRRT